MVHTEETGLLVANWAECKQNSWLTSIVLFNVSTVNESVHLPVISCPNEQTVKATPALWYLSFRLSALQRLMKPKNRFRSFVTREPLSYYTITDTVAVYACGLWPITPASQQCLSSGVATSATVAAADTTNNKQTLPAVPHFLLIYIFCGSCIYGLWIQCSMTWWKEQIELQQLLFIPIRIQLIKLATVLATP